MGRSTRCPGFAIVFGGIAVVGAIGNQSPHAVLGPARLRRGIRTCASVRSTTSLLPARRVQVVSQEHLGVDHHHPLRCPCRAWFCQRRRPFFSGSKTPVNEALAPVELAALVQFARKCRQTFSQTSCSSQRRSRRQQVAGLTPKSGGRSRQRAPVLSTHKMPSRTARLSFHGRPALERLGSKGSSPAHCSSDIWACHASLLQNHAKGPE